MTRHNSTVRRRDVLRGGAALGAVPLAGCTGGDDPADDPGDTDAPGTDADDPGSDPDDPGGGEPGRGEVGEQLSGEYASLTVEYVRSIDEVVDYRDFPDVDAEVPYGVPLDVDDLREEGLVVSGTDLYGVGVAVRNTGDHPIDVGTVMFEGDDGPGDMVFFGRSQRLTFERGLLLPGELARAEVVTATDGDAATYEMTFIPMQVGTAMTEQLRVDLGEGTDRDASEDQSPPVGSLDEAVALGNFEVMVHDATFVDEVEDTFRPEKFGPRSGYRYLQVDLSATRTDDVLVPNGNWQVGVRAADGYGFSWGTSSVTMVSDVFEPNRTRVDQLAVGETLDHTTLAFAVEEDFAPDVLSMTAPGPLEDPPEGSQDAGMNRAVWPIP